MHRPKPPARSPGIYPGTGNGEAQPCANFDLYNATARKLDLNFAQPLHLQSFLEEVKDFWTDLDTWHTNLLQEYKDRVLMIAGVGQKTLFRLEFKDLLWGASSETKEITDREFDNPHRKGDGSVPFASPLPKDVHTRYVNGFHGGLPNFPEVVRDVLAGLNKEPLRLPESASYALGEHLSAPLIPHAHPSSRDPLSPTTFRTCPNTRTPPPSSSPASLQPSTPAPSPISIASTSSTSHINPPSSILCFFPAQCFRRAWFTSFALLWGIS